MANTLSLSMQQRLAKVLQRVQLFASLSDEILLQLSQSMDTQYTQADQVIFNKGDESDAIYVIQSGKVLIYQPDKFQNVGEKIAVLSENDFFGEMGLVSRQPRNASARAIEDSLLVALTKDSFHNLLNENADIAGEIMNAYMKRTKNNQKREFVRTQEIKKKEKWEEILNAMIDAAKKD